MEGLQNPHWTSCSRSFVLAELGREHCFNKAGLSTGQKIGDLSQNRLVIAGMTRMT